MTLESFVKQVNNELSVGCGIQLSIPESNLKQIISWTKKWFYKRFEESVEEGYYIIDSKTWLLPSFISTKVVELPECIISVFDVKESKHNFSIFGGLNTVDQDLNIDKFIYGSAYINQNFGASDTFTYAIIQQSFVEMMRQTMFHPISFNFNRLTNKLKIMGQIPKGHVVLEVLQTIPDQFLFEEEAFFRYVVAKAKINLARLLGTFSMNFPGEVTLNYDVIKDDGQAEIDRLEQEIRDDDSPDFFITTDY